MPFVPTNPADPAEGRLECDWPGCDAVSTTFVATAPARPDRWVELSWRRAMREPAVDAFCPEHVDAGRARARGRHDR